MIKRQKFLKSMELGHIPMGVQSDKSAELNRKKIGNAFRLAQTQTFKIGKIAE